MANSEPPKTKDSRQTFQTALVLFNIVLITGVILAAVIYSRQVKEQKNGMKLDAFCTTVESMKQVSENYLYTEQGYVNDWKATSRPST